MKASKFTEAQIAFVLKQAEGGAPIAEVCRKAGFSHATFYNWRKTYAGLMPSEMKRLRLPRQPCGAVASGARACAGAALGLPLAPPVLSISQLFGWLTLRLR